MLDDFDSHNRQQFASIDYVVFVLMLSVSSLIGLYFGYQEHLKRKIQSSDEDEDGTNGGAVDYLLGGKNIKVLPVSMSLVASFISGITLLGTSTEIYVYGIQYALILFGTIVMGSFLHLVMIPVFYQLKVVSMYEYLQKRFDKKIRMFGSFVSVMSTILYMPICIYVPAIAFNAITGINVHSITPIVMSVCIFYTCLGGIKAVIWTDVIQLSIMFSVMILISIKGTLHVGGLSHVIERNWKSGRIELPDFHIDPTIRHTFWTLIVGGSCYWTIENTNQIFIQRFLMLDSLKHSQKAIKYYVIGLILLVIVCVYNGLLLYAFYYDCDPLTTQRVKVKDQMVPFFVMDILSDMPGLNGIFIAGIFSAALSSLSSALNSMSAIVLEDFVKSFLKLKPSEKLSNFIMRMTVISFGVLSVAMVYLVQHLGSVLQLTMSVPSTCSGTLFGVFIIGMFIPWIGKRATLTGALIASILMIYYVGKAQFHMASGVIHYDTKPFSVDGCEYNFTIIAETENNPTINFISQHQHHNRTTVETKEIEIHLISYLYYLPMGAIITILASFMTSFIVGFEDPNNIDPRLLAPVMRRFFNSKVFESCEDTLEEAFVVRFERSS